MSELHAAVGAVVLGEARAEVARRVAVRERYEQALDGIDWMRPCEFRPDAGPNVAALPVRLAPDAPVDAEGLCKVLLAKGIHARAYFAGRYRVGRLKKAGPTPRADEAAKRVVCLPFWGRLSESEIARIAEALKAVTRQPALAG
jgi:dTDP-4-amino-4,6-dideoxygalactose transaminase